MPALPLIRKRRLYRWARPEPWLRNFLFWGGAIAVGLAAVAFAGGSDVALAAFRWLAQHNAAWPWIAPPLGLAAIAFATQRWFPGTQGSGIPQTIAALGVRDPAIRNRLLSMRIAVGKLLLTLVALGTGASVGREGPTVQIGASIMHSLARWRRFPAADLERGLILAGGAAGIAAAFNTPLAGVVFAIEELSRSFEDRSSGTIYMAVIIAGVTSVALVGNYTYFGTTSAVMADAHMWLAVPICGIAGGVCGGSFSRLMLAMRSGAGMRLAGLRDRGPVRFALGCGLVVALCGWLSHGATLGTGYEQARALVQQQGTPPFDFAPLKVLATFATYVTGIPGGLFSPSLAIGAGLGGMLTPLAPSTPSGAMVVLTMAAYFSGVVQAPLTALVIVSEMTGARAMTLPLMAATYLGRGASAMLCRESLYRALAVPFLGSAHAERQEQRASAPERPAA